MKKLLLTFFGLITFAGVYAQKPQWACRLIETNDPNTDDYNPKQTLFVPDAYPSGGTDNGDTYCIGFTYEKNTPNKIPTIKFKLEYCTPIIAEQIVIVESYKPGTITRIEIEDVNGKKKVVYKAKAAPIGQDQRLFSVTFPRTTSPVRYINIESEPGDVPGVNCIDGVALCPSKDPIQIKINLGSDLHFISAAKPLSPHVNSRYNEVLPVIDPSGRTLYFDRKDHPMNTRKNDDINNIHDDIYYSKKDNNGEWTEAVNAGVPLNNWGHNFVNSISPDGNTMLVANTYNSDGSPKGGGASISRKIKGKIWGPPEELKIDGFNNKNQYVSFFLSNNNQILLMSIEDDDSYGEKDIYFSTQRADGSWTKPANIGPDINTMQGEYSPVLASDNKTMYFASQGHYGYGSYDIYVTRRLDDSWKKWSEPINLGPKINSSGGDMGFSIPASGKEVYSYSSNGDMKADIYLTELGEAKSVMPDPVYLVSGHVYNAKTKKPIHSDIAYELLPSGVSSGTASSDPDNGEYKIVLPVGQHYGYYAEEPGYISVHENLDIPESSQYTEIHKDLYLVPIEVGQKVQLNNIFFVQSKAELINTSYPELDRMVQIMNTNPKMEIRVDGHTDNVGDPKKDMDLSQQRADAVKAYLVQKGIAAKRITTKAFGGTQPIASNAKEETRKLNRRVEFLITKQ